MFVENETNPNANATNVAQQETAEEKVAKLQAELAAKEKMIRDQNSHITKLEAQRPTQVADPKSTTAQAQTVTNNVSAAERYAINKATEEEVEKVYSRAKERIGEEAAKIIEEDIRKIARANIRDPFSVQDGIHDRIIETAAGRALTNPDKKELILGAIAKKPAPVPPVTNTVVVDSPASGKIGTMQPADSQNLGNNPIAQQPGGTKPASLSAFLAGIKSKK